MGSEPAVPAPEVGRDIARIRPQRRDQPERRQAEQRDGQERPRRARDPEGRRAAAGGDRDQRPDDRSDRPRGRDRAHAPPAQDRRIQVGGRCASQIGRSLAASEYRGADHEEDVAADPDREAAGECAEREQPDAREQHRLAAEVLRDAPDDVEREHAEQERDADARAREALVTREPLGCDGADGGVERERRADEDLRPRESPRRADELARDDHVGNRSAHPLSMSHAIRERAVHARGTLRVT